jgi:hypothetical protein
MFFSKSPKKLQPRTTELIERLVAAPWFVEVGQPLPGNVYAVRSWVEAVEFARDPDEVFLEMRNEYTVRLMRASAQRHEQWNDIVMLVKRALGDRVELKLQSLTTHLDPEARRLIRKQVTWVVLHAPMESEYLDVTPARRFSPMKDWIIAGRLPCGWSGKYPQGMLAVY